MATPGIADLQLLVITLQKRVYPRPFAHARVLLRNTHSHRSVLSQRARARAHALLRFLIGAITVLGGRLPLLRTPPFFFPVVQSGGIVDRLPQSFARPAHPEKGREGNAGEEEDIIGGEGGIGEERQSNR